MGRVFETGMRIEASSCPKCFPLIREAAPILPGGEELEKLVILERQHLGITGPNGSGKSTLMKALIDRCPSDGRALYLPQELGEKASEKIMADFMDLDSEEQGRVMTLVRRLGSDPAKLLQSSLPSPGESRKLMFAMGVLKQPCMIFLDEPTNDLDIVAVESLEEALAAYEGTLIVISHDRAFLENTVQEIIIIKG